MSLSIFSSRLKRWAPIMVLGLIPFISGCDDDNPLAPGSAGANKDIVETALGADQFSILAEAVVAADLTATLQSDGPFTVFAPTNDAFVALLGDLGLTKEELFADTALLTTVLTYHVLSGSVPAADAISLAQTSMNMADTVEGTAISLSLSDEGGSTVLYINTSAVTTPNIFATNGVIHEIDKVLLPPTRDETNATSTVADIIGSDSDLSSLNTAIGAVALDVTALTQPGTFTVFAPTNAAFDAALTATGSANLGELVTNLGGAAAVQDIILQHIVGAASVESLAAFAANGTTVPTLRAGKSLPILIEGGELKVGGSTVTVTDIIASNGVIHKIDAVIVDGSVDTM